jgi:hypothetical protein
VFETVLSLIDLNSKMSASAPPYSLSAPTSQLAFTLVAIQPIAAGAPAQQQSIY